MSFFAIVLKGKDYYNIHMKFQVQSINILGLRITRILRFSAYALAIFTEYKAWATWGGGKLEGT